MVGELRRCVGKPELGPEETLGEASEREGSAPQPKNHQGSQGTVGTATTKRQRGRNGPDKRNLWPGQDAGKTGKKVPIYRLNTIVYKS